MNNDRIQEILDLMEEARLDYFLISDPQSMLIVQDTIMIRMKECLFL